MLISQYHARLNTIKYVPLSNNCVLTSHMRYNANTFTLTLTLKIVYLDTTDILQLNYYVQHIGNKKNIYRLCQGDHIKNYGCRYHMTT